MKTLTGITVSVLLLVQLFTISVDLAKPSSSSSLQSVVAQSNDPPYHYDPSFTATGSNFMDKPDSPSLRLTKFSVASWFKTSMNYAGNGMIVNKGGLGSDSAGQNMNAGIWMTSSERIQAGFETSSGTNRFATSPNTYSDGNWHYAVVTNNGTSLILYMDGAQVGSLSTTSTPDNTGTKPLRIGANSRQTNSYFTGNIDEVSVWNRALSALEVADQYNAGVFDTNGQLVYLNMNP